MTVEQYRAALTRLGLAQEEVGRLLGVDPRTARRWALGESDVPGPVRAMVTLWLSRPELLDVVRQQQAADA